MSKALKALKIFNEASEAPISSVADLKAGDVVKAKPGTPDDGMVGYIVQIRPETGKIDVKYGNANRIDQPCTDFILMLNMSGVPAAASAPAAPAPAAAAVAQEALTENSPEELAKIYDKIQALQLKKSATFRREKQTNDANKKAHFVADREKIGQDIDKLHAQAKAMKKALGHKDA